MRVAITGGMGFIGTEVTRLARSIGWDVVMVDFIRDLIPLYETRRLSILDDVYSNLSGCSDVVEPWEFVEHPTGVQAIIHLGAAVDTKDLGSKDLFDRNMTYVRKLALTAESYRTPICFASSASVYGAGARRHPLNPYAMTKSFGENILNGLAVRTTCLRFFNVYGRHEHHKGDMASVPFKIARAYRTGDKFEMHSPDAARDFVSVTRVAQAVIERTAELASPALPLPIRHQTFDVGSGEAVSFRDLDNYIMQAMGHRASCVKEIAMPEGLAARYQGFTLAGNHEHANIGRSNVRDDLEHTYGK